MSTEAAGDKTVLVVEDDDLTREGFGHILRREGYRVVLAAGGRPARDYLGAGPAPDLIVLDMMMPEVDGWGLLRWRAGNPALAAIPVLLVTAVVVASEAWATGLGASGYLSKPITVDALLDMVRRLCPLTKAPP